LWEHDRLRISRLIVVLAVLVPFMGLFSRPLFWGDILGYRDAANYYLPSFEWQLRQWGAGEVPLWNPHDNLGTPHLADASSSVFYPGKLLFALPLDYVRLFNLYTALHVLLAAATSYVFARRWKLGVEASGFAAVTYAFSASVVFQYANVVFLVGAAWLPLALLATHEMLRQRSVRWALLLGCVLAIMTLGGDPQAAYHVVLLVALYALIRRSAPAQPRRQVSWPRGSIALLAIASLSGFVLAAVQILPSMEWTQQSDRAAFQRPRSVWEAAVFLNDVHRGRRIVEEKSARGIVGGFFGEPEAGTHQEHIYHFSVGPWRWAEFLWPNCTGRSFPTNRRWISLIPAEGRAWTPSLYLGLLPLLLALAGWSVRRADPVVRWLSWCALLAVLASLGGYGLGWLFHELRVGLGGAAVDDVLVGRSVGGLYWLMVCLLPGYVYFRYPAKWLVVASLGLSLLAARQLQRASASRSRTLSRMLLALATISLPAALGLAMCAGYGSDFVSQPPVDAVFGPLDFEGGILDASRALLHTGIVSLLGWWAYSRWSVRHKRRWRRCALLLTSVELLVAQAWFTETIPGSIPEAAPQAAKIVRSHQASCGTLHEARVYRASPFGGLPDRWSRENDVDRLTDVVQWERDTLLPKHHLTADLALVESFSSIYSRDHRAVLRVARRHGQRVEGGSVLPHRMVLDALSTRYFIGTSYVNDTQIIGRFRNVVVCANRRAFPRAWIVHDVECWSASTARDPRGREARLERVLFPEGQPRDLSTAAVLEGVDETFLGRVDGRRDGEHAWILESRPQHVVCDVTLNSPGLLLLNDLYYPGWNAWRQDVPEGRRQSLDVIRANGVMRAVWLPAGSHRVHFVYHPLRFYAGAVLSGLGWLAAAIWLARRRRV
jgi:hypothetical protein